MNECIICRKKTTDFSDEHVIPESLGGYYHIYSVCKKCNSILGDKVDSKLVNHKFSQFQRVEEQRKGKKGSIPNPFSGTHALTGNPKQKVRVSFDDNGGITPHLIPCVVDHANGANIVLDAREKDKEKIVEKTRNRIAKKRGVPLDKIIIKQEVCTIQNPEIEVKLSISTEDFKIGFLKIAYEFAVDKIPAYYNDKKAIEISKILREANYEKATGFIIMGDKLQDHIIFDLTDFSDPNKDYLIIQSTESSDVGLLCFIKLHASSFPPVAVVLSDRSDYLPENILIGINDIHERSFRVTNRYFRNCWSCMIPFPTWAKKVWQYLTFSFLCTA